MSYVSSAEVSRHSAARTLGNDCCVPDLQGGHRWVVVDGLAVTCNEVDAAGSNLQFRQCCHDSVAERCAQSEVRVTDLLKGHVLREELENQLSSNRSERNSDTAKQLDTRGGGSRSLQPAAS